MTLSYESYYNQLLFLDNLLVRTTTTRSSLISIITHAPACIDKNTVRDVPQPDYLNTKTGHFACIPGMYNEFLKSTG